MKATERQQLTHNELADAIFQWWAKVKPFLSYVLIGAIVVAAAGFFYLHEKKQKQAEADKELLSFLPALYGSGGTETIDQLNGQIASLDGYIRSYPNSPLLSVAKLCLANHYYDRALAGWATPASAGKPKPAFEADFLEAQHRYEELASRQDDLGREARFGLACATAELGNKDQAEKLLIALAKENPNTPMEGRANDRLKVLREAKPLEFAPEEPVAPKTSAVPSGAAPVKPVAAEVAGGHARRWTASPAKSAVAPAPKAGK